jgi:uncharacterized membrane protein
VGWSEGGRHEGSAAALREYFTGAMWILPTLSVLLALILGSALSQVDISPGSRLHVLRFQG